MIIYSLGIIATKAVFKFCHPEMYFIYDFGYFIEKSAIWKERSYCITVGGTTLFEEI